MKHDRTPALDAAWRHQRDVFFVTEAHRAATMTVWIGLVVQLVTLAIFIAADYPTWRIALLAILYALFVIAHRGIMSGTRKAGRATRGFVQMNAAAQAWVVGSAVITGGVHSPYLPMTVLPAIVSLLFFGPQTAARWTALANAVLLLIMGSLPRAIVGAQLPSVDYTIAILIWLGWFLFLLHLLVGELSIIVRRAAESIVNLREERLGEALVLSRRLESIGAKIAHELKNPLAAIKGLFQLIERSSAGDRAPERLAVIGSELARMEAILREYLSFTHPLAEIRPQPVDVRGLICEVADILDGRALEGDVSITVEGRAPVIEGDPRSLKDALINLVSNALEATPAGGVVALRLRSDAGGIVIEIADTGHGIPADALERLGTPFFTTRPEGTGLGIVLAQGAIAQHGGALAYTSTVGKGTTATITLPARPACPPTLERSG